MDGTQARLVQMKLMFISKLSTFWVSSHAHQASEMKHPQNRKIDISGVKIYKLLVFGGIMKT